MTSAHARAAKAVAERLWPVFGTDGDTQRARRLNDLAGTVGLAPRIRADGTLAWVGSSGELARCVVTLIESVVSHGWEASGTCAGDDCVDVFVRTSGRGSRRYCSPTCLNRSRVRAYRARQRRT
ncbi:CGNR zinc finger domain-containing protein [Nocardiopsis oceani]